MSPSTTSRRAPLLALAAVAVIALALVGYLVGSRSGESVTTTDVKATAPVTVEGSPLPSPGDAGGDPAVGLAAPVVSGTTPDGRPVTIGGPGEPTMVAFLAHWCPHCQRELPLLVKLAQDGAFDGIRTVAVLTGTNPQAPNYPPAPWLDREHWTGDRMLDDESSTAAAAYGLASYPYLVFLDAAGKVTATSSGEKTEAEVRQLVATLR